MYYYKKIESEEVIEIGVHSLIVPTDAEEITEEEYNELLEEFERKAEEEAEANKPTNEYGISDELYDSIIDDYTMTLIEEGVIE